MNSSQIKEIIKLNNNFYEKNALEFSSSRLYPWKGWFKLRSILNSLSDNSVSILDMGCGNGRFLDFLYKNIQMEHITYHGIDNSAFLLKVANSNVKCQLSNIQFKSGDIFNLENLPDTKFDIVVAFGVTHHIPDNKFRLKWFKQISKLVKENGYLIFSFWYPDNTKLLNETLEGFEVGDYLMNWGKNNTRRYVHLYSEHELQKIKSEILKQHFSLLESYINDIKKDSYNFYHIFKKSSENIKN